MEFHRHIFQLALSFYLFLDSSQQLIVEFKIFFSTVKLTDSESMPVLIHGFLRYPYATVSALRKNRQLINSVLSKKISSDNVPSTSRVMLIKCASRSLEFAPGKFFGKKSRSNRSCEAAACLKSRLRSRALRSSPRSSSELSPSILAGFEWRLYSITWRIRSKQRKWRLMKGQ